MQKLIEILTSLTIINCTRSSGDVPDLDVAVNYKLSAAGTGWYVSITADGKRDEFGLRDTPELAVKDCIEAAFKTANKVVDIEEKHVGQRKARLTELRSDFAKM